MRFPGGTNIKKEQFVSLTHFNNNSLCKTNKQTKNKTNNGYTVKKEIFMIKPIIKL